MCHILTHIFLVLMAEKKKIKTAKRCVILNFFTTFAKRLKIN